MPRSEPSPAALIEKIIFADIDPPEQAAGGRDPDFLGSDTLSRGEIGIKRAASNIDRSNMPAKVC